MLLWTPAFSSTACTETTKKNTLLTTHTRNQTKNRAMASAIFHLHTTISISSSTITTPSKKTHFHRKAPLISVFPKSRKIKISPMSIEVSKEDKPLSEEPPLAGTSQETGDGFPEETKPDGSKLDPRRFEEKFAVLNVGIYECRSCGYKYNENLGDPSYPIPPGLEFGKLPEDWRCPTCGAARSFFESKSVEIAGFAQNQQFGLGGNALTSGQKAILIYGSLFLAFILFLSGYFIQ